MYPGNESTRIRTRPRGILAALAVFGCLLVAAPAVAEDLQGKIDSNQSQIDAANQKGDILTTDIAELSDRIDGLEASVDRLRDREADVQQLLDQKQAELDAALDDLHVAHEKLIDLRSRLRRSLDDLSDMLVAVYRSGDPDFLSVVLSSDNYDDLVGRAAYINSMRAQDEAIVDRVRDLRNQARGLVDRLRDAKRTIETARDEIASRKAELVSTRSQLEGRQSDLVSARGDRKAALDTINSKVDHLEDIQSDLQAKLQKQIAAASGIPILSAGPMGDPSAAGLIWPVDGIITSGYGYRWGRLHEGLDIAVPEGTPIRAAASGTVIIAAYTGGYGNYTCIDHGSGLSTCYGHQSGYAVTAGQEVNQGQIIGYSGNTGSSTGPHLHFEVRINGASTDPLGYL